MKPIYRITLFGGQWRLMKDDKLHSTYRTQRDAIDGMRTQQNRDEMLALRASCQHETGTRTQRFDADGCGYYWWQCDCCGYGEVDSMP